MKGEVNVKSGKKVVQSTVTGRDVKLVCNVLSDSSELKKLPASAASAILNNCNVRMIFKSESEGD